MRAHEISSTVGILASVFLAAVAPVGCGEGKTGVPRGAGGTFPGMGGASGIGTGGARQGTGGAMPGEGGMTGTAGSGTGGLGARGTGGIIGMGGRTSVGGGSGGKATLVSGTGGRAIDAGAAGTGAGGRATGGAGGAATGGAPGLDGGTPAECSDITTEAACDARSGCHSVFVDPGTCGCGTPGCCTRFRSCADGDKANCTGEALCDAPTPFCEAPYVIAYRNSCYEGCAKLADCALPPCPPAPPANGASCGQLSQTCYYEDCGGAGRTLATCPAGGTGGWQVATSPCAAIACEDAAWAAGLTCPAGKVCIITTSIGGALITTSACVDHTCGKGPITSDCVPSLYGTCTEAFSAAGAIFRCEQVADCGDAACP